MTTMTSVVKDIDEEVSSNNELDDIHNNPSFVQ